MNIDIGDPFGINKRKPKRPIPVLKSSIPDIESTSDKQIIQQKEANDKIIEDLKLVISDIIKETSKRKKTRKLNPELNATITQSAMDSQVIKNEITISKSNDSTPEDTEVESYTTMNTCETISDSDNLKPETSTDSQTHTPAFNQEIIPADEVDTKTKENDSSDNPDSDSCKYESSTSDSDVDTVITKFSRSSSPILEITHSLKSVNSVINKIQRQMSITLKHEPNHNSRKYKIILTMKRIVNVLKYPILCVSCGAGVYYMGKSYSELFGLIAANPASVVTSLLFSAVNSLADGMLT